MKTVAVLIIFIALVALGSCTQNTQNGCQSCCKNGNNGQNGSNGQNGQNGKHGNNGVDGKNGTNGVDGKNGISGKDGTNGKDGKDGKDGINGTNGKDGKDGKDGANSKGKNWKECAWNNIYDDKDNGMIKTCHFTKKSESTYLFAQVASNMRIASCDHCCKRWFITFDGAECSPVPIDGVLYMQTGKTINFPRPQVILGRCKIQKKGPVSVSLNIGNCNGYGNADGLTGWNSATRIYIEEIEGPQ